MINKTLRLTQPIEHYRVERTNRTRGSGSIVKRSDGRWMGALYVGKDQVTGKYIRKYVYGHSKREVQEKLTKVILEQGVL